MQEDFATIDKILAFLEVENRILTDGISTRMGKYKPDKGTRTLLFNTERGTRKNLTLISTSKLRDFPELQIYISPHLWKEDAEKGNDCLRTRRELLSKGVDPKTIRLRILMLEVVEGGEWISNAEIETKRHIETGEMVRHM